MVATLRRLASMGALRDQPNAIGLETAEYPESRDFDGSVAPQRKAEGGENRAAMQMDANDAVRDSQTQIETMNVRDDAAKVKDTVGPRRLEVERRGEKDKRNAHQAGALRRNARRFPKSAAPSASSTQAPHPV